MKSFVFVLCSILLLSAVIAEEETTIDIAEEPVIEPKDSLAVEVSKQAAAASIKVLNDLLDGKQLEKSLYDRGIEALGKVRGAVASMGKSFMKRVRELRAGEKIEVVAGRVWKASNRKFTGKNKKYDEIIGAAGEKNVQNFVEKVTKVIKEAIMQALKDRKNSQAAIAAAAEAEAKAQEEAKAHEEAH